MTLEMSPNLMNPPRYLKGIETNLKALKALKRNLEQERTNLLLRSQVLREKFKTARSERRLFEIIYNLDDLSRHYQKISRQLKGIETYLGLQTGQRERPFKKEIVFREKRDLKKNRVTGEQRSLNEKGFILQAKANARIKADENLNKFIGKYVEQCWDRRSLKPQNQFQKSHHRNRVIIKLRIMTDKKLLAITANMTKGQRKKYFDDHNMAWQKRISEISNYTKREAADKKYEESKRQFVRDGIQKVRSYDGVKDSKEGVKNKDDGLTFISTSLEMKKSVSINQSIELINNLKAKYALMGAEVELESITVSEVIHDDLLASHS